VGEYQEVPEGKEPWLDNSNKESIMEQDLKFQGFIEITGSRDDGSVTFGLNPKTPLVTIYGQDNVELFVIYRDGTAKISDPARLDEAAKQFIDACTRVIKLETPPQGFVVRKKSVSEFLSVTCSCEEWVQDPEQATHFMRESDAERAGCAPSPNVEVVPLAKAMVF
jgi:hypothetical protein